MYPPEEILGRFYRSPTVARHYSDRRFGGDYLIWCLQPAQIDPTTDVCELLPQR
jgi:hypothetical protein